MTQPPSDTHARIPVSDIAAQLAGQAENLCRHLLPAGRRDGAEWRCGSVQGEAGKSLGVHLKGEKVGIWADFAPGGGSGDLLDLVKACLGLDTPDAIDWAVDFLGIDNSERPARKSDRRDDNTTEHHYANNGSAPPPAGAQPPNSHPKLGEPTLIHEYTDAAGRLLLLHYRFDLGGGKKTYRPLSWQNGAWVWKDPPGPLPLYGLADLAAHPDKPVLLVEGEKTAEVARELLDDYVVTTWPHGAKAIGKIDWSPLAGRNVIAWPDADADGGGRKAMESATQLIAKTGAAKVAIVALPDGLPDKWDLGDPLPEGWSEETLRGLIHQAQDVRAAPAEEKSSEPKAIVAVPLGEFNPSDIPQRRWLLGRRLIRGYITETIAPGGTGKSTFTLQEAVALVTGNQITGSEVYERGSVWVWNNEDPIDEMHRRIAAISMNWGIDIREITGGIFLNSGFDRRLVVAEERNGVAVATPDVEGLINEIRRHDIISLIIDPLIRAHRLRENDNEALDFAVEQFGKIANLTNCAVHLVHHSRKPPGASSEGQAGNPDSSRGASALVYAARVVDTLYGMSEKDGENLDIPEKERRLYVRLDSAKANLSEPGLSTVWFKRESVILPNGPNGTDGDSVGVLVRTDLAEAEERAKREQEAAREDLACKVAWLLEDDEARSLNDLATHLVNSGHLSGSIRTATRRIQEAIPKAPGSIEVDLDGRSTRLWCFKDHQKRTSPILVRRAAHV